MLEQAPRAGGVILTERAHGFVIEAGPDSLLAQKPAALDLCQELGLGDRLIATKPPRGAYVLQNGTLIPIPEGSLLGFPIRMASLARARLFSPLARLRIAVEPLISRRTTVADESIGEFVSRRFGREAVRRIADPLLAGIHAGDVDRLSIQALFPQLAHAEVRYGSVLRGARRRTATSDPQGAFRSLPGGIGELVDALTRALPAGSIRCGAPVAALEGHGPYRARTAHGDTIAARGIIVAAPAYVAADLLPPVDEGLARLCGGVPYASSAAIVLAYKREQIAHALEGSGFVVPRAEQLTITAATWASSKWPGRAPEGCVLLRAYAGGARDPRALDADDDTIVATAAGELARILGIRGEPMFHRLHRWTRSNPQYEVGHLTKVEAIDRALARHPGLFLTGSGYRGVGIPDCIADGRNVGRHAAAWIGRLQR